MKDFQAPRGLVSCIEKHEIFVIFLFCAIFLPLDLDLGPQHTT